MTITNEQRAAVCKEAMEWVELKTPFRHKACLKGVGTDCAGLLFSVFRNAGLLPLDFKLDDYNYQHALHHSEELYKAQMLRLMKEIPESEVKPGDVVLFHHGRTLSHSGIVIAWPQMVHAVRWGVCLADGMNDSAVQGRRRIFFTFKD